MINRRWLISLVTNQKSNQRHLADMPLLSTVTVLPRIGYLFLIISTVGLPALASEQKSFRSFLRSLIPNESAFYRLEIPAGDADPATFIPISVIKGTVPGRTVLMVAGVHGYEFAPILAAKRLAQEVDSETLSGTLIIVRVAHVSAFLDRSPYVNPYDRKNLNRSFPGSPGGTQAERIAWALSTTVIPEADFVLDVHSGDGAEWLEPFVGVYGGPLSTDYNLALSFAEAMRFPNIVRYQMKTQEQIDRGRSLNRQAVAQKLPTILVEIGQNGSRDPGHVEAIVAGIKNGLVVLDMLDALREPNTEEIRYFDGTKSVPVKHSGIWNPTHSYGRFVETGDILGKIFDHAGRLVETVAAPNAGFTLYGLAGPPVRAGDSVVTIAFPSSRAQLEASTSKGASGAGY